LTRRAISAMPASIMNFAAACRRNARRRSTPAARSSTSFPARSNPTSRAKVTRVSNRTFPARATGRSIRPPPSRSDGCGANPTWSRRAALGPPGSPIRGREEVPWQDVAVGYHPGSHFTTLQALEPFVDREQIKLKFVGSSWARVDAGVEGDVPATSVWGITYQVLEQL